jgi:hypothetical protein
VITVLSDKELQWAREKSELGYPVWQIAAKLNVSPEAVYKNLDKRLGYKPNRDRFLPPLEAPNFPSA